MVTWGELTLTVTSASISVFLDSVSNHYISIRKIQYIDDLNVRMNVHLSDYQKLNKIAKKSGADIRILRSSGGYYYLLSMLKRPVMVISFVVWLFLVLYLPSRVLFFRVEGNHLITDYEILNAASQSGVKFGSSRRYVKSEKVKNALISQISGLKWVGVNTRGCVATISVKEGAVPRDQNDKNIAGNLVAVIDGVITEITVTSGNALCKVGQAVRKGQILVSGFTDCGLHIKSGEVNGEVYAITRRDISAVALYPEEFRDNIKSVKSYYAIQIGKNIINLKKCSGILGVGCVKMYEKKDLTLPGGFSLPISFIKETVTEYDLTQEINGGDIDFTWVDSAVKTLCQNSMVAGELLFKSADGVSNENQYQYYGYYICREMISRLRTEELLESYGKRDD